MRTKYGSRSAVGLILFLLLIPTSMLHSEAITTPAEFFGQPIGADYFLASYTKMAEYWQKLAQESDRMVLNQIGVTEEGRPMIMAVITSAENHKNLCRYQEIARKMALAEGLSDNEARALAIEGKAVIWIDGGLHATEVVGAQQEIELVYRMVSRNDAEIERILDQVILLALISNPDGMDLVSDWYMRQPEVEKRSTRGLPRLYQKYVGHDNNRDFYMVTQKETEAVNRILYREWFPQVVYNHHQTGPAGAVLFAPPFREPHSYNIDPLLVLGITTVGNAMHSRFAAEGKPGAVMRDGAGYQTWWNGCLRCTPYFHNMIGILTEMIGNPTPMRIPFIPQKHLPSGEYPFPIGPQEWHFRQSIEYSMTANFAILDLASKLKENFLYNIYLMGYNSIKNGNSDHWTINPSLIRHVETAIKSGKAKISGSGRSRGYAQELYDKFLHDPAKRDARGYILPADQPDFPTAGKFVNTLIKNGVKVHRAGSDFELAGKRYSRGSLVVKAAQAFRPHIIDMFEPHFYPDKVASPLGPPRPPYDSAGYTLAMLMGVEFDRILDAFEGPFQEIEDLFKVDAGRVSGQTGSGYLLSHAVNDAFIATNRLLKKKKKVYWLQKPFKVGGTTYPPGTIYIPAERGTSDLVDQLAGELGLNFVSIRQKPRGEALAFKSVRIGLWDRYGGSMASGWVRWILEQFDFNFEVVYPPQLDSGKLKKQFDVLIFVGGAIPRARSSSQSSGRYSSRSPDPNTIPEEFRHMVGSLSAQKTIPRLREFIEQGGAVLTIGSSTSLAAHLKLPLANALARQTAEGGTRPLPRDEYSIPGSILQVRVNPDNPLSYGMAERINVYFNRSPVFRLLPASSFSEIEPVAWFEEGDFLKSGFALGQHYLNGGITVIDATVGKGKLFLFGPEITFRAQPHGTFKFLFNGIYYGAARKTTL